MMQKRTFLVYCSMTAVEIDACVSRQPVLRTRVPLTPTKCTLSLLRHHVGFVQNNELESGTGMAYLSQLHWDA